MKLLLLRKYLPGRTEGALIVNGGQFVCDTLERARQATDHPCIPEGTYEIELYASPANHRIVPLLLDVPGRSMIEIHPANKVSELLGCIAVGERSGEMVINSRATFDKLMNHVNLAATNNEYIEITIKEKV